MKMKEAPDQLVMFVICIGLATLLAIGFVKWNEANAHETERRHIHLTAEDEKLDRENYHKRRRATARHNYKVRRACAKKYWYVDLKLYGECVVKGRMDTNPKIP